MTDELSELRCDRCGIKVLAKNTCCGEAKNYQTQVLEID